jgi:hypothetical protein
MTRFPKYEGDWTYIGIADAGVYGEKPNEHSPRYPVSITTYNTELEAYFGELCEGGIVMDKRPCREHPEFVSTIVRGPMMAAHLPDNSKDEFGDIQPCDDARKCSGLAYVSRNLYLDMWRKLGARIGVRKGNHIEWEDGERFEIRPATDYNR